jgi:predicted transcriptional regulator
MVIKPRAAFAIDRLLEENARLDMATLAEKLDVSVAALYNYRAGKPPPVEVALKLEEFYKIPVKDWAR